jgi:DNA damage-inducible protein 1
LDPEAQKMIAEEIRQENVNENMEKAMEFIPESFAHVVMLYIDCHVNGVKVKAFVGKQCTLTIF